MGSVMLFASLHLEYPIPISILRIAAQQTQWGGPRAFVHRTDCRRVRISVLRAAPHPSCLVSKCWARCRYRGWSRCFVFASQSYHHVGFCWVFRICCTLWRASEKMVHLIVGFRTRCPGLASGVVGISSEFPNGNAEMLVGGYMFFVFSFSFFAFDLRGSRGRGYSWGVVLMVLGFRYSGCFWGLGNEC